MRVKILSAFLFISSFAYAGGPWIEGKGSGYFQLSYTYLKYDRLLNGWNNPVSDLKREVSDFTLQAYFEYGLTDRMQLNVVLPYKFLRTGDALLKAPDDLYPADTVAAGTLNHFSNLSAGLKYLLLDKNLKVAAKFMVAANTSEYDSLTGLRSGYDAWYFAPSFSIGRGYPRSYYFAEMGFRFKTNNYSNDLLFAGEYGYRWGLFGDAETWTIIALEAVIPSGKGGYNDDRSGHTGLYMNEEGYISPGFKLNQQLGYGLYLNLAVYGAIWADHHGAAPTYNAGLAYKF
ncbi:MAG: hypothetical protein K9G67_04805 [Bacteroidales bacterium]|nr:hypothetical protein [Bacteroidales bacterium]MCF8351344.1 hypothetical protein [Bacteroidales bacterium]MCF8375653.1 hypothetical protein [Bacteroidales bacterium]MCF8400764.1 hypothetical protein [Bacteroidales bacterium]